MIYGAIKPNMFRSRSRCIGISIMSLQKNIDRLNLNSSYLFSVKTANRVVLVVLVPACVSIFVLICVYCYECCSSPLHCVNVSNDSLVLLQMQSAIINNNNTARHPHHLCSARDIKAPQDFLHLYFNFHNQTEYQLGQTKFKPN